jgi:hypothetical protein
MRDLGLQAAQRIRAASDPLRALGEAAQAFPNLAAPLSRVAVPEPLRGELRQLHKLLQAGARAPEQAPSPGIPLQEVVHPA